MARTRTSPPHGVRILGGDWRGRRIVIPEGTTVRPTPDRVRETLFNWLSSLVPGARCLDLYAGTGVLGLEALSRGAREAWFVESDARLADRIAEQIEALDANATVFCEQVERRLAEPLQELFDIVFLDPPYRESLGPLLGRLPAWLTPQGLVFISRPVGRGADEPSLEDIATGLPGARVAKRSRAGRVQYALLAIQQ